MVPSEADIPPADLESLRFPVGRFRPMDDSDDARRTEWIQEISGLPVQVRRAVEGLGPEELDTPYRPGGWTVRQVVHHLPDSHLNSYIRFKLGATEDEPRITTYDEVAWAELPDGRSGEIEPSLLLLEGLHARWAAFLRELPPAAMERAILHPQQGRVRLATNLQLYAWHGRHHLAHITRLRERMGW